MSNAMRSGKRVLAGAAVAALGAGVLTFVAAPSASATPVAMALTLPGVAVIPPDDTTAVGASLGRYDNRIPVNLVLTDANGVPSNTVTGQTLTATVITPTGAVGSNTTSFGLSDDTDAVGTVRFVNSPVPGAAPALPGVYTIVLNPATGGDVDGWNDDTTVANNEKVPTGNYIVRVNLTNTNTGSTIASRDLQVRVLADTARPGITFSWLSDNIGATGAASTDTPSTMNNLGQQTTGTTSDPYFRMVETATGFPVVSATRDTNATATPIISGNTSVDGGTDTAATISTPFSASDGDNAMLGAAPGVYQLTPGDTNWTTGSTGRIRASFPTATTASTSTLPVVFGQSTGSRAVTAVMSTTPQFRPATGNVQLPAGTTPVTFTVSPTTLGDTINGTLPWNIRATGGGTVTPSGGIASLTNNSASITVGLSADAAADLSDIVLTVPGGTGQVVLAAGGATVEMRSPTMTLTAPASQVAKIGDAVPVSGSLLSQFGGALTGSYLVSIARTGGPTLASAAPNAEGAWSLTIPAASSPTAAGVVAYTVSAVSPDPTVAAVTQALNVTYSATGDITALTIGTNPVSTVTSVPSLITPGDGLVLLGTVSTALTNPASPGTTIPTGTQEAARITVSSTPATAITLTAPSGVYLSTAVSGNVLWNAGVQTVTVSSGSTVSVWTTKAGKSDITVTAGNQTGTASVYGWVPTNTARNVALEPATAEVERNTFRNFTLTVTDVFGNVVPGVPVSSAAVQAAGVTVGLAGGGSIPQFTTTTSATGVATISYTAPNATGTAQLSATGAGNQFGTTITGAAASVQTAASVITVRDAAAKSIVIAGSRGTVSGKPGIIVDGVAVGIANGVTVTPFIRFPGQTTFTAGSARPVIEGGEFVWQRKTGKRVTVYVTGDGVTSNRVTIQAN